MSHRSPVLFVLLSAFFCCGSATFAQQAKLEAIGAFGADPGFSIGWDVTDDGLVVGVANEYAQPSRPFRWTAASGIQGLDGADASFPGAFKAASADASVFVGTSSENPTRAFRWTAAAGVETDFGSFPNVSYLMDFEGVSSDGSTFVGKSMSPGGLMRAFRLEPSGYRDLNQGSSFIGASGAEAISSDGQVVVGWTDVFREDEFGIAAHEAFRWTEAEGMKSLGTLGGGFRPFTHAYAVSADGSVIVGEATGGGDPSRRAWIYADGTGIQRLPNIGDAVGHAYAYGISDDGTIVVGRSPSPDRPSGEACVWIDRVPHSLRDLLESYGVDTAEWTSFGFANACSPDGSRITGDGALGGRTRAYCATLRPDFEPPTLQTDLAEGETIEVEVGETFQATFVGTDPDGEGLTVTATELPEGADLTPSSGTTSGSPMNVDLRWTPAARDFDSSNEITVSFSDGYVGGAVSRSFTIVVPANQVPTVEPLDPVKIECVDGQHHVVLETMVDDADDHLLTVTWKVDGEVVETQDAEPGATVEYGADYGHGVHSVEVEVSDGFDSASAGTTVTVQDTAAPIVVVAEDVEVPTDPGEAFATDVVLPEPTTRDASGHPVTLSNDAPETYPLGETIVIWTAEDEEGNQGTATQKVVVVDREAPSVEALPPIRAYCDPGKVFAAIELTPPIATDNVPGEIALTSDAKPRFPIGRTNVVWTAKDVAGNAATLTQAVTVLNRKPQANAGRNVTVRTTTDQGARVSIDGSASSDPDGHRLRFSWSADGVKFAGAKSETPSGLFPLGETVVALTVTDAGGKIDTDTVRVTVRLKPAPPPSRGRAADESFALAAEHAARGASTTNPPSSKALSGAFYARAAATVGGIVEDGVSVDGNDSESCFRLAELRLLQRQYGVAAADALLSAYAETGDESVLIAGAYALHGTASAAADLADP